MKRMSALFAAALSCAAYASEEVVPTWLSNTGSSFGAWRVSAGPNFGFGLKTRMTCVTPSSLFPVTTSPYVGSGADIARKLAAGEEVRFMDGAFISPSGVMPAPFTQNWQVPESSLDRTTGTIVFESVQAEAGRSAARETDDSDANGVSLELSRTLFADERGFGLDFAFGLSWLKADDCFKMRGGGGYYTRTGYTYTPSAGSINARNFTSPRIEPSGGYYGSGGTPGIGLVMDWSDINEDTVSVSSQSFGSTMDASGDYEEWELSFMLRPWYEVTGWMRIHATAGLGLTRSEFEYSVLAASDGLGARSVRGSEKEWRAYGLLGGGVLLRAWMFDVSCDVLARIGQHDMDVDGELMHGKVEKPDLFARIAVGVEF